MSLSEYPDYRAAAEAWAAHRARMRGGPLSELALRRELSLVAAWPRSEAVAGIRASIARGFRHIHPAGRPGLPPREEAWMRAEAVRRLIAGLRRAERSGREDELTHVEELKELLYG